MSPVLVEGSESFFQADLHNDVSKYLMEQTTKNLHEGLDEGSNLLNDYLTDTLNAGLGGGVALCIVGQTH